MSGKTVIILIVAVCALGAVYFYQQDSARKQEDKANQITVDLIKKMNEQGKKNYLHGQE